LFNRTLKKMSRVSVLAGDITTLDVDAIVNAANSSLLGGGGVDGAIHRASGPELLEACRALGGCPTGSVRLTLGYRLRARYVLHAVGPVWQGGQAGEDGLLASCYRAALALAGAQGMRSIAFPAISCGVYRFPVDRAAAIAVRTVHEMLPTCPSIDEVLLVAFDPVVQSALQHALDKYPIFKRER
jgi:O-acetyl-ADP-ribose deacetylase (regulator of RNase III)